MIKTCIILLFVTTLAISIKINRPRLPVHKDRKCKRACENYSSIIPTLLYPYINLDGYIVDGEFPHLAIIYASSLKRNKYETNNSPTYFPQSTGSLISDKFVMTVGQLPNLKDTTLKVRLGSAADIFDMNKGSMREVNRYISHPDYEVSGAAISSDIGLIELQETVSFSYKIRPACLFSDFNVPNIKFSTFGWSDSTYILAKEPKPLTKVYFSLVSKERCDDLYKNATGRSISGILTSAIICAEDTETLASHCLGDAGSPLQYMDPINGMYTILAITSFGDKSCTGMLPGGYTNVTYYLDWIENVTWPLL